ncbi:MAG: NFACT family protein [Oscillospiraceae bacterium]|nr:NFACT family protein [Oscillospiraceae bacterium]
MALDGAFLSLLKNEISQIALGSRVEKISQPSREELVISLRYKGGSAKLLISATASSPRIHFTGIPLENPKSPPMFCMLARKHLNNGKLIGVRQIGMDRIIILDFESVNELGDLVKVSIAVEIMGRHSNIIIIDQNGKIIDAIKRISDDMSRVCSVLPGMKYSLPPIQEKMNIVENDIDVICNTITSITNKEIELNKAILETLQGFSPLVCREIENYVGRSQSVVVSEMTQDQKERFKFAMQNVKDILQSGKVKPTQLIEKEKPKDFSFIDIKQYGALMTTKCFDTLSQLLDSFYSERDRVCRMKQRSHDLLKMLVSATERISRKLETQKSELKACENREEYKVIGDIISANLYTIQKGDTKAVLQNFYSEDLSDIVITLDPMLTPAQNAQRYYSLYRKASTAQKMLTELIEKAEAELVYLDSVFDSISRTTGDSELLEIREELYQQGYIKRSKNKGNKMLKAQPPIEYVSSDGFTILCGRNNLQNDKLTMKTAKKHDMWFHVQSLAGSHAIVVTDGREIPDRTYEEAFHIAAYNSKARDASLVAVDYTQIKNIKKPNGAKPGMVIFYENYTGYITPNKELVESLLKKQ